MANAEAADVAIVFAATDPARAARGISAFLVPMDAPGIRRTPSDSLGVRGLGCMDLEFDDVRVEAGALLGEAGRGFRIAMRALEGGRVAIAAQALGVGQAALDEALAYARQREVFGQPIGDFQAIQFQLADLATDLEAARMLTWRAADRRAIGCRARRSKRRWPSSRPRKPRIAPPIARCRSSRRPATAAARRSSASSATCAPQRSIRGRPKCSG